MSDLDSYVGSKKSNNFGLYDMSGSVDEFCLDAYRPYTDGPKIDPLVEFNEGEKRVVRGGYYGNYPEDCRSAARDYAGGNNLYAGIRLVREVPEEPTSVDNWSIR